MKKYKVSFELEADDTSSINDVCFIMFADIDDYLSCDKAQNINLKLLKKSTNVELAEVRK